MHLFNNVVLALALTAVTVGASFFLSCYRKKRV